MKKILTITIIAIGITATCFAQESMRKEMLHALSSKNFTDADAQYKLLMQKLPAGSFPKTFEKDTLRTSNSGWWCSGFYPGSLLYIFEQTKDSVLYKEAMRML